MLRLIGAALVAAGCAWMGFRAAAVLEERERALLETAEGLSLLEQELKLGPAPFPVLMGALTRRSRGPAQAMFQGCRRGLDRLEEEDFSTLWRRLAQEQSALGAEGRDCLAGLGAALGRGDGESQSRAVAQVRDSLNRLAALAGEERRRQGRVCQALGLSGGAFLAILLL